MVKFLAAFVGAKYWSCFLAKHLWYEYQRHVDMFKFLYLHSFTPSYFRSTAKHSLASSTLFAHTSKTRSLEACLIGWRYLGPSTTFLIERSVCVQFFYLFFVGGHFLSVLAVQNGEEPLRQFFFISSSSVYSGSPATELFRQFECPYYFLLFSWRHYKTFLDALLRPEKNHVFKWFEQCVF